MRDVRFLELHSDLFHAGKNFGKKLIPGKVSGLKVQYDENEKWFEITYMNRVGYISPTAWHFWEPEQETSAPVIVNEHKTDDKSKRSSAQVSTPQSHVFEGRGQGRK